VTVYCQLDPGEAPFTDVWNGIRRVAIPEGDGSWGTIRFDLRSTLIAARHRNGTMLTLGYNTAIFSIIHRLRGQYNFMNMDGLEWKRQKWSKLERLWFAINEVCGSYLANHLIADHPEIKNHLKRYVSAKKITVIPYGADPVGATDAANVTDLGLTPGNYLLVVARPEPENSIMEIVQAYTQRPRSYRMIVLGRYRPEQNTYHAGVMELGKSAGVLFPGAIHEPDVVQALRAHAILYLHGHQVGGTNPSLVEALAAGSAIIAHDNRFNRWVAGSHSRYFGSMEELSGHFDDLDNGSLELEPMRTGSLLHHEHYFKTLPVLEAYERLLMRLPMTGSRWTSS
jgi:glycosyltransferase involved in cell wall biosynthesis